MMRQTKTAVAVWGVTGVLAAGLLLFGCSRHTRHMEKGEHGQEEGHDHGSPSQTTESSSMEPSGKISDGFRTIELKARKFEFDPATVVVKQGEKVRLKVTSEDVTHGIGIADFDIDKKLPPDETVTVEFTADKVGTHHFHCSVYCGKGHSNMHGALVVVQE